VLYRYDPGHWSFTPRKADRIHSKVQVRGRTGSWDSKHARSKRHTSGTSYLPVLRLTLILRNIYCWAVLYLSPVGNCTAASLSMQDTKMSYKGSCNKVRRDVIFCRRDYVSARHESTVVSYLLPVQARVWSYWVQYRLFCDDSK
jgi:hypothetical protein